jgi:hypothetical protein
MASGVALLVSVGIGLWILGGRSIGATLYKLSIAQLKGDFLTSNPIYLKDNFLNKIHNLETSDYSFTSEVG